MPMPTTFGGRVFSLPKVIDIAVFSKTSHANEGL